MKEVEGGLLAPPLYRHSCWSEQVKPFTEQSPTCYSCLLHFQRPPQLHPDCLNMHSVTLSNGEPVAKLHVLLTPPWSDRKLVSVQETKGILNRSQLSPFSRLLLKIKHSAHKQLSAMDNACTGLSCVLDQVRKINGQVSGTTLHTDTVWLGTSGPSGSRLFLTSDQQWADALDASLRLRLAQLRTILEDRDSPLGLEQPPLA